MKTLLGNIKKTLAVPLHHSYLGAVACSYPGVATPPGLYKTDITP